MHMAEVVGAGPVQMCSPFHLHWLHSVPNAQCTVHCTVQCRDSYIELVDWEHIQVQHEAGCTSVNSAEMAL